MPSSRQYGKNVQEDCIDIIVELRYDHPAVPLEKLFRRVSSSHRVSTRTIRRWFKHYLMWGEYPHETKVKILRFKKKSKFNITTGLVNDNIISTLDAIVKKSPELYLDEIAEELVLQTGVHLPFSTIYRTLRDRLGYSLQVCYDAAKQRDEVERRRYLEALKCLVRDVEQVIVIDETHKDKRASRRRRAWAKRNSGGIALSKWFKNEKRYTMIAGFTVNGFIESSVGIFPRDEITNEGAAGTVDSEVFQQWLKERICPFLGDYTKNEPNSIVIMDNASTHMSHEVREMIEEKGAYLLYTAPYSPDLSPIEYAFNVYKQNLKRHSKDYHPRDWYDLHMKALGSITRDIAIKEFRKCKIPFSNNVLTSEELDNIIFVINNNYM